IPFACLVLPEDWRLAVFSVGIFSELIAGGILFFANARCNAGARIIADGSAWCSGARTSFRHSCPFLPAAGDRRRASCGVCASKKTDKLNRALSGQNCAYFRHTRRRNSTNGSVL